MSTIPRNPSPTNSFHLSEYLNFSNGPSRETSLPYDPDFSMGNHSDIFSKTPIVGNIVEIRTSPPPLTVDPKLLYAPPIVPARATPIVPPIYLFSHPKDKRAIIITESDTIVLPPSAENARVISPFKKNKNTPAIIAGNKAKKKALQEGKSLQEAWKLYRQAYSKARKATDSGLEKR